MCARSRMRELTRVICVRALAHRFSSCTLGPAQSRVTRTEHAETSSVNFVGLKRSAKGASELPTNMLRYSSLFVCAAILSACSAGADNESASSESDLRGSKWWRHWAGGSTSTAAGAPAVAGSAPVGNGGSSVGAGGAAAAPAAGGAAAQPAPQGGAASAQGGAVSAPAGKGGAASGGKTGSGGAAAGGKTGAGGAVATGSGGAVPTGTGGAVASTGGGAKDLCAGLIQDKAAHPMTALAKPALGATVKDAEFGTTIRRITAVTPPSGKDGIIVPMYSTVSAWNSDETYMILLNVASGGHQLYDGKTYKFIRELPLNPPDVEQVFWHTSDPDVLFFVDGKNFIRYHVAADNKETLATFSFCSEGASSGSDPQFTSFDSKRIGLHCGDQVFIFDIASKSVIARKSINENPAQMSASGNLAFLSDSGRVTDAALNVVRTLDLKEPFGHSSMGRWPTGEDTWNGQVFDDGPNGNSDIGSLVTFDMTKGTSKVIIGPKTGYPYPPDGHISSMALRQPGWAVVSTFGKTSGAGLLDEEILIANTVNGAVCRVGRHRSWGKDNTKLQEPYWSEPHAVPSPSGTRIAFASDWSNGTTVDSYVLELPSYKP